MEDMTLEQFRAAKQSGVDLYAKEEVKEDAAPVEQEVIEEQEVLQDEPQDTETIDPDGEVDPIPQEQHSAWKKRAERERLKGAEEAESRLKAEYESQLNPYKQFFDQLGINPEDALKVVEQNRIKQEAENLAYQNGWSEEQAQWYVEQQGLKSKQTEMEVSLKVYELADSADYPGIKQMKDSITDFIRQNPNVPVEKAYWAVGGANLATQLKREAEQREIAKRSQSTRKVVSDNTAPLDGKSPLPPEAVAFMKREGMSEAQVRLLMSDKVPNNLEEYRKMAKGRK